MSNQQWHSGDISSYTKSIFAAFILAILTSGCVGAKVRTYSGAELQRSEVAVIKGKWYLTPLYYQSFEIYAVDDKKTSSTQVEVLPGWHELEIINYTFSFIAIAPGGPCPCIRVAFNCEAGHEYKIKAALISDLIEITDVNTGVTIFSKRWPSDEFHEWVNCPYKNSFDCSARIELAGSDEVNTIRGAIATSAQSHGLKQEELPEGYIAHYSGKHIDLKAYYNIPPSWIPNTKSQTSTIVVRFEFADATATYPERKKTGSLFAEIYEQLQKKIR